MQLSTKTWPFANYLILHEIFRGASRWKFKTGIEVITGKSSTDSEMAQTRNWEVAVRVLSFFGGSGSRRNCPLRITFCQSNHAEDKSEI